MGKKRFEYGIISKCGLVKEVNQDRILIKIGEKGLLEFGLFVIADGMGGHELGEVASTIAICELTNWWDSELRCIILNADNIWTQVKKSLLKRFNDINQIILSSKDKRIKMGTTLTVLFLYGDKYIITHIGDSRVYTKTNIGLKQLTKDHSLIATQLRQGILTKDKVVIINNKNILTQCMGIKDTINPFCKIGSIKMGSTFLLCSDGLYNFISKDELEKVIIGQMEKRTELQEIANKLYSNILKNGAGDNVSIILINYR